MPLGFANPALLFGGLAAALPVIIHFLSRRRVRRVEFSDISFLQEVQAQQARSLGVRRWLLLLLRVLAILALALAVAGPRWGGLAVGAGSGRSLVFVLDVSASMGTQQEGGTRLQEALDRSARMMESLPDGARVQVVTSGSRTGALFGDWLPAGAGAVSGLSAIESTDGAFDLKAALLETARLVSRAPSRPVDVVLISDFQENPLPEDLTEAVTRLQGAGQARLLLHQVGLATPGGGVVSVALPARSLRQGESGQIIAHVTSHLADQAFVLEVEGKQLAEAVLEEPSTTPVPLTFSFSMPAPGLHRGRIVGPRDAFSADDERPFVLAVPERIPVLVVHGTDREVDPAEGRGGWRYLAEALAPGGDEDLFRVRAVTGSALTSGDLAGSRVVFLVDPDPLGRSASESLRRWLREGGALALLVGQPTAAGYLENSLLPLLGLEPGVEAVRRSSGQGLRLTVQDGDHPVFAGLDAEALGTLQDVTWARWFRLTGADKGVLMSFADEAPALVTGRVGEGRFALMPFNLLPNSTRLAASPMALPFFQRLTAWLATGGMKSHAVNTTVGNRAAVVPEAGTIDRDLDEAAGLLVRRADGEVLQTAELLWQGDSPRLVGPVLDRSGIVTFVAGRDTVGMVAAQVPAEETHTGLYSLDDWTRQLGIFGLEVQGNLDSDSASSLAETLTGRDLGPGFFALAFLLLFAELFVGRGVRGRNAS